MPVGALVAGPLAAAVGVPAVQYGAAALIIVASALALIPRDVRTMRASDSPPPDAGDQETSSASPVNVAHIAA
jgi:hypothetical protein